MEMGTEMWIDSEVDVSRVALTATVAVAVAAAPESATAAPCRRQGATNRRQRGQRTRLRLEDGRISGAGLQERCRRCGTVALRYGSTVRYGTARNVGKPVRPWIGSELSSLSVCPSVPIPNTCSAVGGTHRPANADHLYRQSAAARL